MPVAVEGGGSLNAQRGECVSSQECKMLLSSAGHPVLCLAKDISEPSKHKPALSKPLPTMEPKYYSQLGSDGKISSLMENTAKLGNGIHTHTSSQQHPHGCRALGSTPYRVHFYMTSWRWSSDNCPQWRVLCVIPQRQRAFQWEWVSPASISAAFSRSSYVQGRLF